MKKTRIFILLMVITMGLGACGKKGELEPPEKHKDSVAAVTPVSE